MTGKPREKYHIIYLKCWRCGHHHFNTCLIRIILVGMPTNSWYVQPLEYSQASENGMEALELDTSTETVSVLENSPPLEGVSVDLQVWQ